MSMKQHRRLAKQNKEKVIPGRLSASFGIPKSLAVNIDHLTPKEQLQCDHYIKEAVRELREVYERESFIANPTIDHRYPHIRTIRNPRVTTTSALSRADSQYHGNHYSEC